jgi:hypothetical protein
LIRSAVHVGDQTAQGCFRFRRASSEVHFTTVISSPFIPTFLGSVRNTIGWSACRVNLMVRIEVADHPDNRCSGIAGKEGKVTGATATGTSPFSFDPRSGAPRWRSRL